MYQKSFENLKAATAAFNKINSYSLWQSVRESLQHLYPNENWDREITLSEVAQSCIHNVTWELTHVSYGVHCDVTIESGTVIYLLYSTSGGITFGYEYNKDLNCHFLFFDGSKQVKEDLLHQGWYPDEDEEEVFPPLT